ncbi:uroporphyrinogen decarboxylase [Salpingoeca rosetta]|uniref:Uroporphyrinogen decarboxylase n=1 Tax=Salpingoeca rosetta (strain ATCC 50818 / BSB-021) TaxID=946362 RepID=F2UCL6_SALR5|nr:uroporphyrinogen decarboxylase [Salpingoeca rosetta]EGD74323.1 uroporphyrinogen decarboxylase [Salpingoeca rosetta]|eukprot:XP_004993223.1 uroporphyrinogen decarboxylase [Salpingoeca rosetta]
MATLAEHLAERREPEAHELEAKNFPELKNDLILRAARREDVERVPVWVMRQAGRYLPEYNAIGEGLDFFDKCRTPALACAITLQPLVRFPIDAAIIFSDILVILQALGMHCDMVKGKGPTFPQPITCREDIDALNADVDVHESLGYVFKAITLTRHRLGGHVPLIGFAGAPWTLFAYAIEGSGSKTFSKAKSWLYKDPEASHRLLSMITDVTVRYLVAQVRAGAQLLQVFDSWAGSLSPRHFREFAAPYLVRIASAVKAELGTDAVPMICFAKGAHWAFSLLESSDYDVLSLDWTMDPQEAQRATKSRMAFQGNMDPCAMYGSDDTIREEVCRVMSLFGTRGHIANMGHGMSPDMEPRAVAAFVDAVHNFSSRQRVYTIGTRGSVLALWQAHYVLDRLVKKYPTHRFRIKVVDTAGDKDLTTALDKFGTTGVFTDALERALVSGEVDCVVHSLKDVPSTLHPSTRLAAISERHDPRDCVVFNPRHNGRYSSIADLPPGSVLGTSSARRRAFLARAYPSLTFKHVRGNVKTRLRKLDDPANGYDALVLASAGLERLNMEARVGEKLSVDVVPHAVGQAALGVQVRCSAKPGPHGGEGGDDDDDDGDKDAAVLAEMLHASVQCNETALVCSAERGFLRSLGGGCSLPIAVRSQRDADTGRIVLCGNVCSVDGKTLASRTCDAVVTTEAEAAALGEKVAADLKADGGEAILIELRAQRDQQQQQQQQQQRDVDGRTVVSL